MISTCCDGCDHHASHDLFCCIHNHPDHRIDEDPVVEKPVYVVYQVYNHLLKVYRIRPFELNWSVCHDDRVLCPVLDVLGQTYFLFHNQESEFLAMARLPIERCGCSSAALRFPSLN